MPHADTEPSADIAHPVEVAVLCLPDFNALATTAFLDPLRIANYLSGVAQFHWTLLSIDGGPLSASNATTWQTRRLTSERLKPADWVVVSASWTPERYQKPAVLKLLRAAAGRGALIAGLDTGAFLLAEAGLLARRSATVHYEHIDALAERYPSVRVVENKFVLDGRFGSCCGGSAGIDFALHLLHREYGEWLTNAVARYLFHDRIRPPESEQNPRIGEPIGFLAPAALRLAIRVMEAHLEEPLRIPEIATRVGLSQRQLARLFCTHTGISPQRYYAEARLDRARGLITQTALAITEVALACGYASPEHFSRAYRRRFGLAPRDDRIVGRIPFEYRAWPMHSVHRDRSAPIAETAAQRTSNN